MKKKPIMVHVRIDDTLSETRKVESHGTFKCYGEMFAITQSIGIWDSPKSFVVTHIKSGAKVPGVLTSKNHAADEALKVMHRYGRKHVLSTIRKAEKLILKNGGMLHD